LATGINGGASAGSGDAPWAGALGSKCCCPGGNCGGSLGSWRSRGERQGYNVLSTRAPDVADNLPWNWRGGSCRILPETFTMAATDDVVPQVEVGIQGTRPRVVPTAWERTWAGMTRRAESVAVDWLWRGRHLDLKTGSLVRVPIPQRGPAGRRRYQTKIQTLPPATSDGCT
jgi:hypothetical protein